MNNSLLPAGAKAVSADELKGLHTRRSFLLYDSDEITFADSNEIAVAPLVINGEEVKNDSGEPVLVYSVECTIRHKNQPEGTTRLVPIGTFTKRPAENLSDFFSKSPLLTDLGQCVDDFERYQVLKQAHKIVVDGFYTGKATDWQAQPDPVTNHRPLREAPFAILRKV